VVASGWGGLAPGVAGLHLAEGVPLLRPEEQVFAAMLDGWRNQQLARNLAFSTINGREKAVRAFSRHADAFPWLWSAQLVDEWLGDRRAVGNLKRSTLRNYQEAVRSFCAYIIDPCTVPKLDAGSVTRCFSGRLRLLVGTRRSRHRGFDDVGSGRRAGPR
jgi:hypothetical protein